MKSKPSINVRKWLLGTYGGVSAEAERQCTATEPRQLGRIRQPSDVTAEDKERVGIDARSSEQLERHVLLLLQVRQRTERRPAHRHVERGV